MRGVIKFGGLTMMLAVRRLCAGPLPWDQRQYVSRTMRTLLVERGLAQRVGNMLEITNAGQAMGATAP